jgi:hypothetical protein
MGLRGTKYQGSRENYIMRSLMICTPHPTFHICLFLIIVTRYRDCILACRQLAALGVTSCVHLTVRMVYYVYGWSVPNGAVLWTSPPLLIAAARVRIMASVRVGFVVENMAKRQDSHDVFTVFLLSVSFHRCPQNHPNFQSFSYQEEKRAKHGHLPTVLMFLRKHQETQLTSAPEWNL